MVKNNRAAIASLLFALTLSRISALPQPAGSEKVATPDTAEPDKTASFDLPFLQFKNGGIRVNFLGYHAEAGLGGLLGGSEAKGGLYASAGTPWGPSASAGLGGSLGGADGSAGGGLHARAGLGNGGPEAAAGLGGSLDGSGRSGSRARGRLYAGATAGGPKAAAGLDGNIDEAGGSSGRSYSAATNGLKTKVVVKHVSNIQQIAPITAGEKVYLAKSGEKEPLTTLEFKLPASNEKKALASSLVAEEPTDLASKDNGTNGVVSASDVGDSANVVYLPRRYHRKRLRSPARKQVIYKYFTANVDNVDDIPAVAADSEHSGKIVARQAIADRTNADARRSATTNTQGKTIFDDIFNIPISTLAAVNQLLNNRTG